jgi:integrase
MDYESLKREVSKSAATLSQYKLRQLRLILSKGIRERYPYSRIPKYGDLSLAFTDTQFEQFLSKVRNGKLKFLFKMQAILGLRIGEVVGINIREIDFNTRELVFESEKVKTIARLLFPLPLFDELKSYINSHKFYIYRSGGYLFYKDSDNTKNHVPHIDPHYAAKKFNEARKRAGLDEVYGHAKGGRPLYRFSTHSLRRYGGTHFHQVSKDILKTSKYLRHLNIKNTVKYVCVGRDEIYHDLEVAFNKESKILNSAQSVL